MQVATLIVGDPVSVKNQLVTLAAANTIQNIKKTSYSGTFIVLYEDSGPAAQGVEVLQGDPEAVEGQLNYIITVGGFTIDVLEKTFSASYYLVVYQ